VTSHDDPLKLSALLASSAAADRKRCRLTPSAPQARPKIPQALRVPLAEDQHVQKAAGKTSAAWSAQSGFWQPTLPARHRDLIWHSTRLTRRRD
jgi:hypothetical protein